MPYRQGTLISASLKQFCLHGRAPASLEPVRAGTQKPANELNAFLLISLEGGQALWTSVSFLLRRRGKPGLRIVKTG